MLGNITNTLNPNTNTNDNNNSNNSNNDKLEMMSQRILTKSYKM